MANWKKFSSLTSQENDVLKHRKLLTYFTILERAQSSYMLFTILKTSLNKKYKRVQIL